jgi:hypothetical protein
MISDMRKHRRLYRRTGCMQRRSGEDFVSLVLAVRCRTRQRENCLGWTGLSPKGVKGWKGCFVAVVTCGDRRVAD